MKLKNTCYAVVLSRGPEANPEFTPGKIIWFDEQWREEFAMDPEGKNIVVSLPSPAIYGSQSLEEAIETGVHMDDEIRALVDELRGTVTEP